MASIALTASASPRATRSILVVFAVALAMSVAMVLVGFQAQRLVDPTFDPYNFGEMGKSLARGEGFAPHGTLIQRRAPLYPLMIGGVYTAIGEQPLTVLLLQSLFLAATAAIVFDIGRRLFNERTGVIAGLLTASHPMLLRYVGDLQVETLLTFLFTLTVWAAIRFYARPTVTAGLALGICAALTSLTKAVALPFPVLFAAVVVGISLWRWRKGDRVSPPWAALAAMFLAMIVLIAPWTVRNYFATGGKFVLLSSGASDAFLRGYVFSKPDYALLRLPPYTFAEIESNEWFRDLARAAGTEWERDDYETDQILNRAAMQKLVSEPAEFVRKFSVGLFTFWYQTTSLTNSLIAGGLALAAWVLAVPGLIRARREGRPIWLLLLPVLYLNVFLAALLALGRYSVPIVPTLLVISAFGVDTLLSRRPRLGRRA